jgi:peptidoglycan-associated lipoprotein
MQRSKLNTSHMASLRVILLSVVALLASACTCKPHAGMMADASDKDNIGQVGRGPLADVHFAFDSYALDGNAKGILKGNAEWLKNNAGKKAQVEGHCDERGTNEYNMVLGANRARAAHDYLRSLGVEASRLSTISYGEDMPLDPAHNEKAWATNRRASFKVN